MHGLLRYNEKDEDAEDSLPWALGGVVRRSHPNSRGVRDMELRIEVKDMMTNRSRFYSFDKGTVTIGRNASSDIPLKNKYISDRHASLHWEKDALFVRDRNSSNGTEYYARYEWTPLGNRKKQVPLPVQLKLAKAVVVTIQSGESKIVSLSDIENDAAIMVLDICGSTGQSVNDEQIAYHSKQRLNLITKPILFKAPVLFYKNTGDGFLATFSRTTQAVDASIKILKELKKRNARTNNPSIDVRIGLHKGRTYVIDPATEDIHGIDINITFRIEGLRSGAIKPAKTRIGERNRILASEDFYSDFRKRTRRKHELFEFCGSAKLKGIKERKDLYLLRWE